MRSAAKDLVAACSVQTLHPLAKTLERLGVDVDAVLGEAGLVRAQLSEPFLRIPIAVSREVWAAAVRHCEDPALGLRIVEDLDLESFSLFTYLSATSATPRDAHERATRYARIAHDGLDLQLEVEGDRTICSTRVAGEPRSVTEAEFAVGMMFRIAPLVVGDSLEPELEAWFRHPAPSYADQYERVIGWPVHFEQRADALVGTSAHLDQPLPKADSTLCALIEAHAAELLAKVPEAGTFADEVRQRIASALPDGDPSAEGVAETLGMSTRTLRRRLHECDTSHQRLLDEVRHGIARTALAESGISVNEVAYLLGFSDASAFTKAFKRWTGRSPGATLRELRGR